MRTPRGRLATRKIYEHFGLKHSKNDVNDVNDVNDDLWKK